MSGSPFRLSAAVLAVLTCASCGSTSPSGPSGASGGGGTGGGLQLSGSAATAGRGNGGGGGGGTATDFDVAISGGISLAGQMQADRDNKKQLAASATLDGVTVDFGAFVSEGNCTWTGQGTTDWDDTAVTVLRQALGDPAPAADQTRAVNFQVNHNGDGTGTGAIRLLSVPEGAYPWVSYCFNTGQGLCSTNESVSGDVRTFTFSGSAARAVLNDVELVCSVGGIGATIQVTPR